MDQERYYVQNGELKANGSRMIPDVLIDSMADLEKIKNLVEPGTIAHLKNEENSWELSANHEWVLVGSVEI